ncbi:GPI ethanolamine phosphate transferase [Zalerion maritima]|uniref:GPI ethanolamine phosphate transferase n=1 Tax=Zalerion maritima TaxID=339359 RepID=A0AAD5WQ07_9PEZI|nr:GPI ethanolamine phosphate transferase [Zalerion maritima]
MPPKKSKGPMVVDSKTIASQMAAIKAKKAADEAAAQTDPAEVEARREEEVRKRAAQEQRAKLDTRRKIGYERRFWWTFAFWAWLLFIHAAGIGLFTSGFLLTRLVLDERSTCDKPPIDVVGGGVGGSGASGILEWDGMGTVEGGCWHPKTFDRAVVVIIDALRYDFTVPVGEEGRNGEGDGAQIFHNAFPFLHDTAVKRPNNAILRPFIADPPTTTLQRIKGLTTGTLPTFIDMGSNFAGTAIEEDNLLMQLRGLGKKIAHLGDDTWDALFPGYFEGNISRSYDSLNVWDLHTVDTGVMAHIFPLMEEAHKGDWDLLIGHLLGVDHAGHRYGPDHSAMRAKLLEMDRFIRDLADTVDDDTLLVVMGDHGMDGKGDHGGESDDEVEAAVWMYSPRPVFGRTSEDSLTPPPNAKVRPVNQIDLVPTLALLLGIPIPYNNLGKPIEEAFAGVDGNAWDRLAAASQVAGAGINRYLGSYFAARGLEESPATQVTSKLWVEAEDVITGGTKSKPVWADGYFAYTKYQEEALRVCKDLWARFDVPSMVTGILIMLLGLLVVLLYVSRDVDEDPDFAIMDDDDLMAAEGILELQDENSDLPSYQTANRSLTKAALIPLVPTLVAGVVAVFYLDLPIQSAVAAPALLSIGSVLARMMALGKVLKNLIPTSIWGWMAVVFTVSQSIGFASNSYTIWEDSILLFFISTFGLANVARAFRLESTVDRSLAIYHSLVFVALGRVASMSKLCREEQMPYCTSTYYASTTSSTSSMWQLLIPIVVAIVLPSVVKGFMAQSRSYEGLAPAWIGMVWRGGLLLIAGYWFVDAADNGGWYPTLPAEALKTLSVHLARVIIALAVVAGSTAFVWAPPCVSVFTQANPREPRRAQVTILGFGNVNGARFLLVLLNVVGVCMLLTKPMGIGALGTLLWQILALVEVLDLNELTTEAIGPVMLGLLGNLHYFKTGHQAVLSSIQWDSAFIAFFTIRYPWTPLAVIVNHFAGQLIATAAVPLTVMWKTGPRRRGIMENVGRNLGALVAFFAVEAAATMMWAGHLRRHLMLYRVFSPRYMLAAAVLLVADLAGMLVALVGTRTNALAVGEVFGFAD